MEKSKEEFTNFIHDAANVSYIIICSFENALKT